MLDNLSNAIQVQNDSLPFCWGPAQKSTLHLGYEILLNDSFGFNFYGSVPSAKHGPADVIAAWRFDESSASAFAAAGTVNGSLMGDADFTPGGRERWCGEHVDCRNWFCRHGQQFWP